LDNYPSSTSQPLTFDVLIVGAGPAGMMAAEHTALAGLKVAVTDAMPSPARKFLMAGKSGLNLNSASIGRRAWAKRSSQAALDGCFPKR
jgi:predicted flavoprotein YhiN